MNTSKGEEKIIRLLTFAGLSFEREKAFKDLKHGDFKYDFYIPTPDETILVEFDGPQHFEFIAHFHKNRQGFLKQQEYDRRKNSYALAKGYKLYRIPYWEYENLAKASDLFQKKFLVIKRDHNDYLRKP